MFGILLIVFLSFSCFVQGHHDGSEEFAHCQIRGGGAGGHVCFKEQDHQLTAHVHVTHIAAGRLTPVHVHENAWTPSCNNLGGHYNLPGTAKDEGNLGKIQADENCVARKMNIPLTGISISGRNSILGRSVKVHLSNGRKACCKIVSCTEEMFNRMMNNANNQGDTCN